MITLVAGTATAEVVPECGGRVGALRVDGIELLVTGGPADPPMVWGSFPMAPWCGRVRDAAFDFDGEHYELVPSLPPHAGHGTVWARPWALAVGGDDDGAAAVQLTCALGPDWPLGGHAEQRIELRPDALECRLAVVAGDRPMPAELGWHPWFRATGPVDLRATAMYERAAQLPTGRLVAPGPPPWDDCFLSDEPVRVPVGRFDVQVSADTDHVVVFNGSDVGVAVEPQTGPPDAFHLRPRTLRPSERLEATMTIAWT